MLSRGNNRNEVFHDEKDYAEFINMVITGRKHGITVYRYALMNNHFHLIIKSPAGEKPGKAVQYIKFNYTGYYRKRMAA